MREKIHEVLVNIYGVVVAISALIGGVVAGLFLIAFIINGDAANSIAQFNSSVMSFAKKMACFAIWVGLIDFYLRKEHALTIDEEEAEDDLQPAVEEG